MNQNSTTIEDEKLEATEQAEEVENNAEQHDGKALTRGQKKKLKKKAQKDKVTQEESSEVANLASKINDVKVSETTNASNSEETKSENKDEVRNLIYFTIQTSKSDTDKKAETEPELTPEEQFQKELAWCIRQLKLGLENNKVNKDQRNILLSN